MRHCASKVRSYYYPYRTTTIASKRHYFWLVFLLNRYLHLFCNVFFVKQDSNYKYKSKMLLPKNCTALLCCDWWIEAQFLAAPFWIWISYLNFALTFCSVFIMDIVYLLHFYKQKEKIKPTSKRIRKQQPNKIKSHQKLRIRKSCIFNSWDWFIIQCKWDKWFKPNFGMKLSN